MAEEAARAFFEERNEENTSQEIAVGSDLKLHFPEARKSAQAATVSFPIFLISTQDRKGLKSSF